MKLEIKFSEGLEKSIISFFNMIKENEGGKVGKINRLIDKIWKRIEKLEKPDKIII